MKPKYNQYIDDMYKDCIFEDSGDDELIISFIKFNKKIINKEIKNKFNKIAKWQYDGKNTFDLHDTIKNGEYFLRLDKNRLYFIKVNLGKSIFEVTKKIITDERLDEEFKKLLDNDEKNNIDFKKLIEAFL